ncbi:hypothetical protein [Vibrio sp. WXL210]|uniref:hypothetical protein n=1 Tax=Vibrio sp. WXL210 TaxID=3450709 RepID=UPI003EC6D2E4
MSQEHVPYRALMRREQQRTPNGRVALAALSEGLRELDSAPRGDNVSPVVVAPYFTPKAKAGINSRQACLALLENATDRDLDRLEKVIAMRRAELAQDRVFGEWREKLAAAWRADFKHMTFGEFLAAVVLAAK